MQSHEDESQEERATGCTDAEGLLPWFTWIYLEYFEVTDASSHIDRAVFRLAVRTKTGCSAKQSFIKDNWTWPVWLCECT